MYVCILCSSGRGSGGLLFNHKINWFGDGEKPPEECPTCGSGIGIFEVTPSEPAAIAVLCEIAKAQRQELALLDPQDEDDPGASLHARVFVDAQPGSTFAEIHQRYAARYADVPAEQVFKDVDELLYALGEAQAGFSGVLKLMEKRKVAMEQLKADLATAKQCCGQWMDESGKNAAHHNAAELTVLQLRDEVTRLRAAVIFADEQGAEAIDRVSKRLIADKWNSTAAWQARALAAEAKLKQIAADNTTLLAEQRGAEIVRLTADLREHNAVQVRTLAFLKGLVAFPDAEQVPDPELPKEVKEVLVGIGDLVREQHSTVARLSGGMVPLNGAARACSPDIEVEIRQLRADLEESRLTLAAEQGKQEGAPSARWRPDGRHWYADRSDGGMDKIELYANLNGDGTVRHARVWLEVDAMGFERERGRFGLARAAMLAADAVKP